MKSQMFVKKMEHSRKNSMTNPVSDDDDLCNSEEADTVVEIEDA